jgi:hypothetical protein
MDGFSMKWNNNKPISYLFGCRIMFHLQLWCIRGTQVWSYCPEWCQSLNITTGTPDFWECCCWPNPKSKKCLHALVRICRFEGQMVLVKMVRELRMGLGWCSLAMEWEQADILFSLNFYWCHLIVCSMKVATSCGIKADCWICNGCGERGDCVHKLTIFWIIWMRSCAMVCEPHSHCNGIHRAILHSSVNRKNSGEGLFVIFVLGAEIWEGMWCVRLWLVHHGWWPIMDSLFLIFEAYMWKNVNLRMHSQFLMCPQFSRIQGLSISVHSQGLH